MFDIALVFEMLKDRRLSQNEFANKIGVSPGNLSDWKVGKSSPSRAVQPRIAEFFGVSLSTFYTFEQDPANQYGKPVTRREALMSEAQKELEELPEGDLRRILEIVRAYKRK